MSDCSTHAFDAIRPDHIVAGKANLKVEHDRFGNRTAVVLDGPPATRFPKEAVTSDDDIAMALRMVKVVER